MMEITSPGTYNITSELYHKDPCIEPSLSRSTLYELINDCPARAWHNHPRLNPDFKEDNDKKFDLGTAAHELLLEGVDSVVIVKAKDWRTDAAKVMRDQAIFEGKVPLLEKEYDATKEMVKVAKAAIVSCKELGITSLMLDGESEQSLFWKETPPGSDKEVWLRVRPDWKRNDNLLVLDYKTTRQTANPNQVDRTIANMQLDIQESFYRRGMKAVYGTDPKFILLFQEVEPPHFCSFIGLTPAHQEKGKQKCDMGIFLWAECMSNGKWPGYPNRVCWIEPKPWELTAWEERAQHIGTGEEQ